MSDVFGAAFLRAILLGVLTGGVTTLTSRQQDMSWEDALIAGAIVLLTTIIARGGLEGSYDSHRAAEGNLNKGDVPVASDKVTVTPVPQVGP